MEFCGQHLVPFPILREGAMGIGFLAQLQPIFGCSDYKEHPSQALPAGDNPELAPDRRTTTCGGILTTKREAEASNANLSAGSLGTAVHGLLQCDNWFYILTSRKSVALMLGFNTPAVYALANVWKQNLAEMDAAGYTEGRIRHIAHSQGGHTNRQSEIYE